MLLPSEQRPLSKGTPIELGLLVVVVGAVSAGAWRLSSVVHEQESQGVRVEKLEQRDREHEARDAQLRTDMAVLNNSHAAILQAIGELKAQLARSTVVVPASGRGGRGE
jgi:hypothetical protein